MQQGSTWQHPVRPDGAENAGFLGNTDALQAPTQSPKWQHHISNGDFGQPLAHSQQPISGCRCFPLARCKPGDHQKNAPPTLETQPGAGAWL